MERATSPDYRILHTLFDIGRQNNKQQCRNYLETQYAQVSFDFWETFFL